MKSSSHRLKNTPPRNATGQGKKRKKTLKIKIKLIWWSWASSGRGGGRVFDRRLVSLLLLLFVAFLLLLLLLLFRRSYVRRRYGWWCLRLLLSGWWRWSWRLPARRQYLRLVPLPLPARPEGLKEGLYTVLRGSPPLVAGVVLQPHDHRAVHRSDAHVRPVKQRNELNLHTHLALKCSEDLLGHRVLEPVPVVMLQRRYDDLPALPPGRLQLEQGGRRGFPPLGQEDDEGQRLQRVLQQTLEVRHRRVHQLLAERRVRLERPVHRLEVQDGTVQEIETRDYEEDHY